jgi:hypothetical protein
MDRGDTLYYYWDKSKYSRQVVSLNSADRIDYANTTPNDYTVYLKTPLLNVCAIRLISTIVPNTQYVINATNNYIDFIDNNTATTYAVVIPPGTYTATELANQINSIMNTAVGAPFGTIFTATYITYFQKMRIDRIDGFTFTLLFGTGLNIAKSVAPILGFNAVNKGPGISFSGDVPVSLMGEPYIYLCIKDVGTLVNEKFKDVFARILFSVPPKSISYDSFASNAKIYRSPLTKVDRFDVRFITEAGLAYDFNHFENTLILEVYTLPTV